MADTAKFQILPQAAVRALRNDPEWSIKAGTGGLLYAVAVVLLLINPLFFPVAICLFAVIQGYSSNVINRSFADSQATLPEWRGSGELLIAGLTWMALSTVRLALELGIAFGSSIVGLACAPTSVLSPLFVPWAAVLWSFLFLFWAAASFLSTYLFASFSVQQDTKAAFAIREVLRRFLHHPLPMILGWLLSLSIFVVAVVAPIVTVLGAFLVPSTAFVAQMLGAQIVSQVWRQTQINQT